VTAWNRDPVSDAGDWMPALLVAIALLLLGLSWTGYLR
jgi:hypothetical protein